MRDLLYVLISGDVPRNSSSLAVALGVSTATVARLIAHLRRDLARDGAELVSVRTPGGWHYRVKGDDGLIRARWEAWKKRGLIGAVGRRSPGLKPEDELIYGDGD